MIDTIFFDVGNTLRVVKEDKAYSDAAKAELMRLVGYTGDPAPFFEKLNANWKKYRKMAKTELLDAGEMELWSQYMLPDYDPNIVCANAGKLTRCWRNCDGRRVARPDVISTVKELTRRGYTIGIIANTITESEIPDWLIEDGIIGYFKAVILSSKVRFRKPDPAIYLLACRAVDKKPENCAYVGDNPIRDVQGTRRANFAKMIRIDEPDTLAAEPQEITPDLEPDHIIENISDLLAIFPPLNK